MALIRTLNDDDADIVTVRDIIARDPALTATLLRMANSAMFGLSRSVNTLDTAVSVIGMAQIRARALSVCLAHTFSLQQHIDRIAFWNSCMKCAGYARWLALILNMDENQAWLTGMLLRLGRILIVQHDPQLTAALEALPWAPGEQWERQRTLTGFDEGQIMSEVTARWDFPLPIVQALNTCARPTAGAGYTPLAAVLHLAALLADHPSVSAQTLAEWPQDVVDRLQLDLARVSTQVPDATQFTDTTLLQG